MLVYIVKQHTVYEVAVVTDGCFCTEIVTAGWEVTMVERILQEEGGRVHVDHLIEHEQRGTGLQVRIVR